MFIGENIAALTVYYDTGSEAVAFVAALKRWSIEKVPEKRVEKRIKPESGKRVGTVFDFDLRTDVDNSRADLPDRPDNRGFSRVFLREGRHRDKENYNEQYSKDVISVDFTEYIGNN